MLTNRRSRRSGSALARVALVIVAWSLAACGSAPMSGGPGEGATPAVSATSAVSAAAASTATSERPPGSPSAPPTPAAASDLLRLCRNGPPEPTDIDCTDAVAAAIAKAKPGPLIRAELTWSSFCPAGAPCPSEPQRSDRAYVVLYATDGGGVQVPVALENGGLVAGEPAPLSAVDLGPRPTFASPPAAKADVGPVPAAIATRSALPLCGTEDAHLAGPFDTSARSCFLESMLAGDAAELGSKRTDVGGAPFVELWRFEGSGPAIVFSGAGGRWSRLECAVTLVAGADQLFDHTDCVSSAVP